MATILVIEDDPSFLDLLRLHLLSANHSVNAAENPEQGLHSLLENPPDLILLDLDLPYLSGFEVLEALRGDPASHNIPVIIVTARSDDETHSRCKRTGVDGFLTKPLRSDRLIDVVGKVLASRTQK